MLRKFFVIYHKNTFWKSLDRSPKNTNSVIVHLLSYHPQTCMIFFFFFGTKIMKFWKMLVLMVTVDFDCMVKKKEK